MKETTTWQQDAAKVLNALENHEGEPPVVGSATGSETFRQLCSTHPGVNYKTAWGCPDCVVELREQLKGLIQECEYSASSGLPFNFPEGKGNWTQLAKAKALISKFPNSEVRHGGPDA